MATYTSVYAGPPRSGRFALDDVVIDVNGRSWRCVRGTSPRQWVLCDVDGAVNSVTGLAKIELGGGVMCKTKLTFTDMPLAVTNANAYGGQKVYTFPECRLLVFGVTGKLNFKVQGANTTINDAASLTWGLGSATASNKTLATTMIDLLPKTTIALGTNPAASADSPAVLASTPSHFDGTSAAIAAYLNCGFETDTEIDADGVLLVNGSITMVWANLGDV